MPCYNMLFTHKKHAIYSSLCVQRGKTNGPPHPSDLLYQSLTIWIANRTIYHGAVIYFMLAAQVWLPEVYGNGMHIMNSSKSHFV